MEPQKFLANQRFAVGGSRCNWEGRLFFSSTFCDKRPPRVSLNEVRSTVNQNPRRKMCTKCFIHIKSIRHSLLVWRGHRQLHSQRYLHRKSRNADNAFSNSIRSHIKSEQKAEFRLGSEDILNPEAPLTPEEIIVSEDVSSKGQGTLQGAMALIIGTSVGAGILALPARTLNAGFIPTMTSMSLCWCFLVLEALLLAEVNVALLEEHKNRGSRIVSLCAMAEKTLGPLGGILSAFIYSFLSYTMMVAYIAKSGDVLSSLIHISPSLCCWTFTLVVGSLILLGDMKLADSFNQILTITLIGVFILIIMGGLGITDWSGLQHMNWEGTPETFPVIFFALVYHDLMPVLCMYLKGDIHRIRQAVLLGSAVPMVMFVSWDAVILCIAPISGNEDPLDLLTRLGGTSHAIMIELFSILALATSFIGTLIGFMEFFKERLSQTSKGKANKSDPIAFYTGLMVKCINSKSSKVYSIDKNDRSKGECDSAKGTKKSIFARDLELLYNGWMRRRMEIASFVLILAPPLLASTMVSDAFFTATDLAGGYGMTTLYGLFPPIMAWSLYERGILLKKDQAGSLFALSRPQVQGILAVSGTFATGIIVSQLILDCSNWS